jgi:NACHT domain
VANSTGRAIRLAWVAAGGAPGVAGLVTGHQVLGVVLLCLCEALVGCGMFVSGVVKDISGRWRLGAADWVNKALGRAVSRFDLRYRSHLLNTVRLVDSKGLPTRGFFAPELTDVYVDLTLAPREPHLVRGDLLADLPPEVTARHRIERFLGGPNPVVLAVVGAPGSGKTTLLRHTARHLCDRTRRERDKVPILLYLRDHVAAIVQNPHVSLERLVRQSLTPYELHDPGGWFELRLTSGRCLVLLDGLDEVARAEDRRRVADWVDTQITRYAKNSFVITSRPEGYNSARIDRAAVLQVRSFDNAQVRQFVHSWYLALERKLTTPDDADAERRARDSAADLLDRLKNNPTLHELTVNPLLLTMMANVHHSRGALPGSRVDLYGEICQAMLWRRQEAKKLTMEMRGDQKENLLRRLAFTMMEREVRDLPKSDVLAVIRPGLRRLSPDLKGDDFLADVGSNGLLLERESGQYSFAHLTFQEFLAASYIRDRGLVKTLAEKVDNVWWRETTLLYTARSEADEIVRACLRSASVAALSLAFDCVEQNTDLEPGLRVEIEKLLASGLADDTTPERRRLIAGVLATRHLRQLVSTDSGIRVCARPITNSIYGLFLKDTGLPGPDGPIPSDDNSDEIAAGVWGTDAIAFSRWISQVTDSEITYRLPTREEMNSHEVQRITASWSGRYGVWLEPSGGVFRTFPDLWTAPHVGDPYMVVYGGLKSQVEKDIVETMPTLFRLLLLRTIVEARSLGDQLEYALGSASNLLKLGSEFCQGDADLVMLGAHSTAIVHTEALVRSLSLVRDVALWLGLAAEFSTTWDVAHAILYPTQRRAEILDGAVTLWQELVAGLDPDLAAVLALDTNVTGVVGDQIMGRALSESFTRMLRTPSSPSDWSSHFAEHFFQRTGNMVTKYVVSPDTLETRLAVVRPRLLGLLGKTVDKEMWADRVANSLSVLGKPVFARKRPVTSRTATAIRLAALCLAVEAAALGDVELGADFRQIAAGTMILEQRARSKPPAEIIMLVQS